MMRGPRLVAVAAARQVHRSQHASYGAYPPAPPQEEILPKPVYVTRVEITDVERIGEVEYYLIRVYAQESMSVSPTVEGKGGTYAQQPQHQQQTWTISHRYGDWKNLREALESQAYLKTICEFPRSNWSVASLFSKRAPLTDAEVETRKRELVVWLNEVIGIVRSEEGPRGATPREHEAAKKLLDQFLGVENHFRRETPPPMTIQQAEPIPVHSSAYEAVAYPSSSSAPTVLSPPQVQVVVPSAGSGEGFVCVAPVAVVQGAAVT